ncbi:energy transducer TonB [Acinetobacter sp. ANC 4178]|nr:energy transducer TonB [Acinetobacter sp. ANC 4178]
MREDSVAQAVVKASRQNHQLTSEALSKIQAVKQIQAETERPLIVNDTEILQSVANADKFDAQNYQPVAKVEPSYPEQALDRDLEGNCTVVYNVNENGGVELPKVEGDCHPLFVESFINAALNFKYQPYVFDGHAVMVQNMRYTFQYQISKSS